MFSKYIIIYSANITIAITIKLQKLNKTKNTIILLFAIIIIHYIFSIQVYTNFGSINRLK